MRLIILRHGATASNEQRRYAGRMTDEPLSETGRGQCRRAGVFERIRLVYVSPQLRARQTAAICFPAAAQRLVTGLEEFDFGAFEGRTALEMADDRAYRAWVESGCMAPCPGGDSRQSYVARVREALTCILREAAERGDDEVIVVAHGGTVMAALHALTQAQDGADDYFGWHVGCCEGYEAVVVTDGGIRLARPRRFARLPLEAEPR